MAVVTIGNFDGVHRGHRHLIEQVVQRARQLSTAACAVTFDPHPRALFRPEAAPAILSPVDDKVRSLRAAGLDDIWVCRFTRAIAQLEPEQFLDLIAERWPITELWVGHDFALGRGRSGTIDVLREIGREREFRVEVVQPLRVAGQIVSSSRIRALLANQRLAEAAQLLAA